MIILNILNIEKFEHWTIQKINDSEVRIHN